MANWATLAIAGKYTLALSKTQLRDLYTRKFEHILRSRQSTQLVRTAPHCQTRTTGPVIGSLLSWDATGGPARKKLEWCSSNSPSCSSSERGSAVLPLYRIQYLEVENSQQ